MVSSSTLKRKQNNFEEVMNNNRKAKTLTKRKQSNDEEEETSASKKPKKEMFMETKQHARSLSLNKMVYARDDDPEDTVIIRSFFEGSPFSFRQFGVKGLQDIENLFMAILQAIDISNQGEFMKNTKYVDKKQFEVLFSLIEENREKFTFPVREILRSDGTICKFVEVSPEGADEDSKENESNYVRIAVFTDMRTEIALSTYNHGEQTGGIYLFVSELYKLLKYLNTRFLYSLQMGFVYRTVDDLDDNFF